MSITFFLTGGTGFIGSRVAEKICQQGGNVRALVRNVPKAEVLLQQWPTSTPRNIEFVSGDLFAGTPTDRMKLFMSCLKGANVLVHVAEAKTKEKDFDAKNIKAFGLLLEGAHATPGLRRVVFVSAFMAGGLPQPLPETLTEEMTGVEFPDRYYQWKRMAERLLIKGAGNSHYSYSIVRPALVYGPNAEWLKPMLSIIKMAGRFIIPMPNGGTALLGTVHVEDVASTIALCGINKEAENQIIHAADNGATTYNDWFTAIADSAGWRVTITKLPKPLVYLLAKVTDSLTSLVGLRLGGYLWAQVLTEGCSYSNQKMRKIIGPLKYPTIREGIPGMMKWFIEPLS